MKPVNGSWIRSSSCSRVISMLELHPASSANNSVATSVDSRSFAARHCSLSWPSCPTAAVLAGSTSSPYPNWSMTRSSKAWSI
ncbi:Uncharacterised protein [Mycobacterium tuberculosis]|nr:Uncharacterised protein [Mycobacterium tuberculosis]